MTPTGPKCATCGRNIFPNGGHAVGCSAVRNILPTSPGFYDRHPGEDQQFVSVWDEVTYYTDDSEGDRQ